LNLLFASTNEREILVLGYLDNKETKAYYMPE
jgi:hypothetical protein